MSSQKYCSPAVMRSPLDWELDDDILGHSWNNIPRTLHDSARPPPLGPTDPVRDFDTFPTFQLTDEVEAVAMSRVPISTQSLHWNNGNQKRSFDGFDTQYANSYTYGQSSSSALPFDHRFDHVQVYDPGEYCNRILDDATTVARQCAAKKQRVSEFSRIPPLLCDHASTAYVPHDMSTSTMTHLSPSSFTTSESMSRQSSVTSASTSVTEALNMLRVESSFSNSSDFFPLDDLDESFVSCMSDGPSSSEATIGCQDGRASNVLSDVGFCSGTDFSFLARDDISPVVRGQQDTYKVVPFEHIHLESDEGSSSSSSADIRASQRRRKHIENAKQQSIAPKSLPGGPKSATDRSTAVTTKLIPAQLHNATHKHKEAISRTSYVRPQHPKLYCDRCTAVPLGFRGDHELRRHYERAHAVQRKVWICVEPSVRTKWWPQQPLSICKQCKQQKHYNVYYNAAAHLRRAHFNPRKRGRKARGEERESRAGKAGGDWPPIEWLKANGWLKQIEIQGSAASSTTEEDSYDAPVSAVPEDDDDSSGLESYDILDDLLLMPPSHDPGLDALGFTQSYPQALDFGSDFSFRCDSSGVENGFAAPMMQHTVSAPPRFQMGVQGMRAGFVSDGWM